MQQIIDDLKSIPGVIGAFAFRTKQGILCNNLPSPFKPERLTEIAKTLIIFPLNKYFLGILKGAGANRAALIEEVDGFLQRLVAPSKTGG
jgi:hypothetical protein